MEFLPHIFKCWTFIWLRVPTLWNHFLQNSMDSGFDKRTISRFSINPWEKREKVGISFPVRDCEHDGKHLEITLPPDIDLSSF
jgi:hypothetical protein